MAQGPNELQALVDAHFETLAKIIADTVSKLEALQGCIPDGHRVQFNAAKIGPLPPYYTEYYTEESDLVCPACNKVHNPPYKFACD